MPFASINKFMVDHEGLGVMSFLLKYMHCHFVLLDSSCITRGKQYYVTYLCRSDTFTVCMETITAFIIGPLCFATVLAYVTRSPYRYVLQMVVSLAQLYGDSLYMSIEAMEGFEHGEYNHPLHFWFYFVFLNLWWIFVPLILIIHAAIKIGGVQATADVKSSVTQSKKKKK